MARFRFTLEPVLRARLAAERQQQRIVAMFEMERRALEDRLRAQQGVIQASRDDVRGRLVGTIDPAMIRHQAASVGNAMRTAQKLLLELSGAHQRLATARAQLVEASRRRRAVELIRERRFAAWKRRLSKAEDAMLDELAASAEPDDAARIA